MRSRDAADQPQPRPGRKEDEMSDETTAIRSLDTSELIRMLISRDAREEHWRATRRARYYEPEDDRAILALVEVEIDDRIPARAP